MKRLLNVVVALVFIAVSVFAFSSCKHEHVYGEWSYAKLPTCTEEGVESRMCAECGETEERSAAPLGHAEVKHEAVAPTCTETGNEEYVSCSRCEYTTFKQIDALGHKEVPCNGKPATCTEKGYEPYVFCERCEYRTFKEIPALGHDEVQHERKQPTCLETGWSAYVTCSRCDYTTFKEIPKSGHMQAVMAAKEPTCTETGLTAGSYCKVCNVTIRAQETVAANGHRCNQGICTVCGVEDYVSPDQYVSRVCYEGLLTLPRGEQMQKAYDLIYEAARKFHIDYSVDSVGATEKSNGLIPGTIDISHLKLLGKDMDILHAAFESDNPIFYWYVFAPPVGYVPNDKQVNSIRITVDRAYSKGADRKTYNEQIADKVKHYVAAAEGATSKYETALRYYEAIINTVSYAHESLAENSFEFRQEYRWTQNIIGVFCKDRTVCAGYGKAFCMLLSYSGIEARPIIGYASSEKHLWSIAKMDDGNWYWFDPTWDDAGDDAEIEYRYFCVNDTQKVNWHDSLSMNVPAAIGTITFLDRHDFSDSGLTAREKNYYVPQRSSTKFSSDNALELREPFEVNGLIFARKSIDEVQLVGLSSVPATLVIPDKVSYNGMEFKVTSVGYMMSSGLFDNTRSIGNGYAKKVVVPRSVELIMSRAISGENVSVEIFYEGTREEWFDIIRGTKYYNSSREYFYSETRPTTSGNYWHYVNGTATPW